MKIKVLYSSNPLTTITKPEKVFHFSSKKDAKEFLREVKDIELLSNYAIETKKSGYLCNGLDFLLNDINF